MHMEPLITIPCRKNFWCGWKDQRNSTRQKKSSPIKLKHMSYSSRVYRQRNAHTHDDAKKEGFFSKQHEIDQNKKDGLRVNEPGDSYEKEADAVAGALVNHPASNKKGVQQKRSGSVQRLSTSTEEDKFSTNDARMKKDKDVQRAPMGNEKEKEKVQKKDDAKKEEEKVQKKEEPKKEEEKVQKKEEPNKEKEKVMRKEEPEKEKEKVQKKDEPKKEEEKVQRQPEGNAASLEVSGDIIRMKGGGEPLPTKILNEMNAGFGKDFGDVRIHSDQKAAELSDQLEAQAFTHRNDIYFNSGKFDPDRSDGKFLLAHELTHVMQQQGAEMQNESSASEQQPSSDRTTRGPAAAGESGPGNHAST